MQKVRRREINSDFIVAVHALVFLHHKQDTLSSEELAKNICTNPVRVRRVLTKLHKAGLLESRRGHANGGYHCEDAGISLSQVAAVFDGQFVETAWRSGEPEAQCPICAGMSGYMDGLFGEMNQNCIDYLARITVGDVERQLCSNQKGSIS